MNACIYISASFSLKMPRSQWHQRRINTTSTFNTEILVSKNYIYHFSLKKWVNPGLGWEKYKVNKGHLIPEGKEVQKKIWTLVIKTQEIMWRVSYWHNLRQLENKNKWSCNWGDRIVFGLHQGRFLKFHEPTHTHSYKYYK